MPPSVGAGIAQAGLQGILIDRFGHPIYYAIHMNPAYVDFLKREGLTSPSGVRAASSNLSFPSGVAEFKSAWQLVPPGVKFPTDYITTQATVPVLAKEGDKIVSTGREQVVTVALLALHVAFVMPGHPEFVWSTFEHVAPPAAVDQTPIPNLAPTAQNNPPADGATTGSADAGYPLYMAGTPFAMANAAIDRPRFNVATQTFVTDAGTPAETPIFRAFRGSKSNTTDADDEVDAVNISLNTLFSVTDKRRWYRLVGAVWLDKTGAFKVGAHFRNDDDDQDIAKNGTDSSKSILGGEDRLSSVAIESFTQASFPHCLFCHDTTSVKRDADGAIILEPKELNVSHVLSKAVDDLLLSDAGR